MSLNGNKNHEDAFTNALLHDIGLIAMYTYDNDLADQLIERMETQGRLPLSEEKNLLGIDHVEVGSFLAEKWGLPDEIRLSILCHHNEPDNDSSNVNLTTFSKPYYFFDESHIPFQ